MVNQGESYDRWIQLDMVNQGEGYDRWIQLDTANQGEVYDVKGGGGTAQWALSS